VGTPPPYAAEARERWGNTAAFRQSQRRAAGYSATDWARIRAEAADLETRLADAMRRGLPASGEAAIGLAEAHREHLSRWFYDCSAQLHRGLGDIYVADERFTAHYDEVARGLASYVRDAIHANADRLGSADV
jgi:hypothetical protein